MKSLFKLLLSVALVAFNAMHAGSEIHANYLPEIVGCAIGGALGCMDNSNNSKYFWSFSPQPYGKRREQPLIASLLGVLLRAGSGVVIGNLYKKLVVKSKTEKLSNDGKKPDVTILFEDRLLDTLLVGASGFILTRNSLTYNLMKDLFPQKTSKMAGAYFSTLSPAAKVGDNLSFITSAISAFACMYYKNN